MNHADDLVVQRPEGLYCPPGDFYIDPWRPVERAVITHAHADHARARPRAATSPPRRPRACCAPASARTSTCRRCAYGEAIDHFGVRVSLHPAGHVLGSAQVRLEHGGRVWVASGDYYVAGAAADPREDNADLRAVRAGALPLLHHRIDLRPADLPLAAAGRAVRRDRRLVARQRRGRPGQPADGLQLRQGAAHPGRRRPLDRADRRARRGRAAEPRLPRRRRRRCRRRRW